MADGSNTLNREDLQEPQDGLIFAEDRRRAWNRSVARNTAAGFAVEPRILMSVGEWIKGSIDAQTLRARYLELFLQEQKEVAAIDQTISVEDEIDALLAEVPVRSPQDRASTTQAVETAWRNKDSNLR